MPADIEIFKEAMAQFATGVTIVATRNEGHNYGITANAFCSVSLEPPLVLVCVATTLHTHAQIEISGVYAVSVLSIQQIELADRFAGRLPEIEDRFAGIPYETALTGSPIIRGALSWVDCEVRYAYPGGDHTIFVGEVVAGSAPGDGAPLLYYQRRWSQLAVEGPEAGSNWPRKRDNRSG